MDIGEIIKKELQQLEGHDVIVLIGILILILVAVRMTQDLSAIEARSFFRESLINIAILLLVADLIIHVGRLEEKILKEEAQILTEEKTIIGEEKMVEKEMTELGMPRRPVTLSKLIKKKKR